MDNDGNVHKLWDLLNDNFNSEFDNKMITFSNTVEHLARVYMKVMEQKEIKIEKLNVLKDIIIRNIKSLLQTFQDLLKNAE